MEFDTQTPKYLTSEPTSFASDSARLRWPVILTGVVDDIYRAISKTDKAEKQAEGKQLIEQIGSFKYELLHDRKLSPILEDDQPDDVLAYNTELDKLGNPSWLDAPWLFAECYLYRRLHSLFRRTSHWKTYDVFSRQKTDTFRTSRDAVLELASRYKQLIDQLAGSPDAAEATLFAEFCDICLWGNATDLSLLTNLTYEDIQKLQGSEARKAAEKNLLVNEIPAAYEVLKKARDEGKTERRVDFILDNAGFELYVDLVLAGFLLSSGLATQVVLRPKSMPWFVSDVVPADFSALLNAISSPRQFFESQSDDDQVQGKQPKPLADEDVEQLLFLFQQWAGFHAEGQLVIRPSQYWTAGGSFWRLPHEAPDLYRDLQTAELVIFKGDLNYRKLTGDARWDPTTPFTTAIGPLGPGSGVNVLSLRTCKADVVVGLPPGKDEELRGTEGGGGDSGARKWAWHGKWAVASLSKGKASS